jgi:hypothetical protein
MTRRASAHYERLRFDRDWRRFVGGEGGSVVSPSRSGGWPPSDAALGGPTLRDRCRESEG